jgi:hypothetical protein
VRPKRVIEYKSDTEIWSGIYLKIKKSELTETCPVNNNGKNKSISDFHLFPLWFK